eukprot:CAMPEP_0119011142 /NCGR_PEP_ID=MMETSP1176-20130426/5482_1 /TAXON_ID=265551 /ORGANISM="Synedropsis recta cf, Strain CCMP1620" /LENGTH=532 /DNA_ID=CAMNT_0006963919 /DNA_START=88 /DNA_END=1686 /DNA_ORIENTATION=-
MNRSPQMPKWEQARLSSSINSEAVLLMNKRSSSSKAGNRSSGNASAMKHTLQDLSHLKIAAASAASSVKHQGAGRTKKSSAATKSSSSNKNNKSHHSSTNKAQAQAAVFVSGPAEHMCRVAGKEASRYGKDFEKHSTLAHTQTRKVTELRWSDLEVGKLLGTGAFCHVYEAVLKPPPTTAQREQAEELEDDSSDVWDLMNRSGIDPEASVAASPGNNSNDREAHGAFAIKQLDPHFLKGKNDFADCAIDLIMEAKILACLHHPNIIKLHAVTAGSISKVFTNRQGGYFLLLDRLNADSLTERIREWADGEITASRHERAKRLEDRLKTVALGISEGMKYLHKNMVIYRDLKPSNIGFARSGEVKLYDFGLAREILDDGRKMTGYTGSARYMAPEVARSDHYGLSADVYSFGILLWELCSLQKAFSGMTKEDHIVLVVGSQQRPKLGAIEGSSSLKKIIQACWSHESKKRPSFSDIRDQLCFDLDLPGAPNATSNNNRFMRLRKQSRGPSEKRMGRTLSSLFNIGHKETHKES